MVEIQNQTLFPYDVIRQKACALPIQTTPLSSRTKGVPSWQGTVHGRRAARLSLKQFGFSMNQPVGQVIFHWLC